MAPDPIGLQLERVAFFAGERLTAAQLTAAATYERELRQLHNRALHDWGIASGLGVTGAKDDRAVTVAPGYAIDRWGREIVVAAAHVEPVPAVAGGSDGTAARYLLTVAYTPDEDAVPVQRLAGVCAPSGTVRLEERPSFRWRTSADLVPGIDVVLASVQIKRCRLSAAPTPDQRRDAALGPAPQVGAGATDRGHTRWRFWPNATEPTTATGVTTTVDTSAAGFRSTPAYQARVAGQRGLTSAGGASFMIDGQAYVYAATPESFDLRVVLVRDGGVAGRIPINPANQFTAFLTRSLRVDAHWHVVWMGVET
jgi:hypothetical protein